MENRQKTRKQRGNPKVLIIEDDRDSAMMVRDYFLLENFDVVVENDGNKAAEAIGKSQPDVIILDMLLGEKHGLEILEEIPHPRPVVLAVTGDFDISGKDVFEKKAHAFFRKPFDIIDLVAAAKRFVPLNSQKNANSPCAILSSREKQVLNLICEGYSARVIGARLDISHRTVEKHRQNVKTKFDGKSFFEICTEIQSYFATHA